MPLLLNKLPGFVYQLDSIFCDIGFGFVSKEALDPFTNKVDLFVLVNVGVFWSCWFSAGNE